MVSSDLTLKSFFKNLPTITRNILIVIFATILIGCAYYIYKNIFSQNLIVHYMKAMQMV